MARLGRGAHRLLVGLGSLAAVLILVIALGLWRLTQGPIELDGLTPFVQEALNRTAGGLQITISGGRVGIDGNTHQLGLWLEGVRVSGSDGEQLAALPEMSAAFSVRSLLRGRLTPTRLVVEHPVLRFVRDRDGAMNFGVGDQEAGVLGLGPEILEQLAGPPEPEAPFGLLRRVVVRDATFVLDDRRIGRRWQADRVDAMVERSPNGFAGDLSLALALRGRTPELHASYRYSTIGRTLDLALEFGAIEPAALASFMPELAPLAAINFPVSGTIETRLDFAGHTAEGLRVDLGFGKGWLESDLLPDRALAVEQGELHAVYAPESAQLRLVKLWLDLGGGSVLTVKGSLDGITPGLISGKDASPAVFPGKLGIVLADVPVAKFESLWPPGLSRGGRRWVLANVRDGVLDQAAIQLDLAVDPAARSAEIVSARGSMHYRDLTISYFSGLAAARKVSGSATLADKTLEFTPTGGAVKSVEITGGSLHITNLGAPVESLAIDLALTGPIRDVLEVIDTKPLRYAHEIGVDPAQAGGRTEINLHFKLPLLQSLKFDQVEYGIRANLTDAAIAKVAMGHSLSDGNFALEITPPGIHLRGNARVDAVASDIDASLFFKAADGLHARYRIALTLNDEQRRRLGYDYLPDRLAGPVGIDLTYLVFDAARAEANAVLDLRAATLSIAEAGWQKPFNMPAQATLVLDLENEQVTRLREIAVRASGLDGRFALLMAPDRKRIDRVDIHRLVIGGDDDLAGSVSRRLEGGWHVDLRGRSLDLTHWIKGVSRQHSPADPPLLIDAHLGRLILGPTREVRDLAGQVLREGAYWQAARINGRFANGRELSLRFNSKADKRGLTFLSDDLGSTLSLLDVTDNIAGGRVTITGQISDAAGGRTLHGHVEAADYNFLRAPGFARVLSLASLGGVGGMLAGTGIPFTTLRGDFAYRDDHLVLDNVLAYGGAIGVTANGVVELGRDRLDLQGTIVPAYALNSIFGNIPLIGSLLMGGEGQGLFGATYRLTGSAADPQVSVNPLSALAPGFLRRLFQPNFGFTAPVQESLGASD